MVTNQAPQMKNCRNIMTDSFALTAPLPPSPPRKRGPAAPPLTAAP